MSGARVVHEWCKSVVDGSLEGEMAKAGSGNGIGRFRETWLLGW